jgi:hypothetical protein
VDDINGDASRGHGIHALTEVPTFKMCSLLSKRRPWPGDMIRARKHNGLVHTHVDMDKEYKAAYDRHIRARNR